MIDQNEMKDLEDYATDVLGYTEEDFRALSVTELHDIKKEMDGPPAWREALSFILGPLIAVIFVLFLDNFIIINARIPSASMENTIMTGDRLIGNRLAYKTGHIPQRGDVIIFPYPDDPNTLYIKRVIGLPGEMVTIRDGKVYINDSEEPLDDSFVPEEPIGDFGPYYIPGDDYFVMGDNRNNSWDSRFWENQFVPESTIVGKAIFRYYPFDQMGTIEDDVF